MFRIPRPRLTAAGLALGLAALLAAGTVASATAAGPMQQQTIQHPYWDDRSGPEQLIQSYFNAINRKEYARAYSYWEAAAAAQSLPAYEDFRAGFAETASVMVWVGWMSQGAGAGQLYYEVPVALQAETTSGETQAFAGCYTLHLSQPAIQGMPPFRPLAIQAASVQELPTGSGPIAWLATACGEAGGEGQSIAPGIVVPEEPSVDASRYIDDRSTPVSVLRSYYNAINRHEYVRAYSYWRPQAAQQHLPPYPQFEQGYAETQSVELQTGTVRTDVGAGQINSAVPIALEAQTTSGATQWFAGCYRLHLSQPAVQEPPFEGIRIQSAAVHEITGAEFAGAATSQDCE